MHITQFFGTDSKSAHYMRYDLQHAHGTIFSRYERPSQAKIRSYMNISNEYQSNAGCHEVIIKGVKHILHYNDDLKIANAGCQFYSTVATFTDYDDNKTYIIKETHANTYMCEL